MQSRLQPIDIKALPPAHRALFQLQQTAFQAQQTANDELRARVELLTDTNRRLEHLIGELRRAIYDKKSEKRPLDDRQLAFEDLEGAVAEAEEAAAAPGTSTTPSSAKRRAPRRNLGHLPRGLERIEHVIEPDSTQCPCGCGDMIRIGEDRTERLDIVPAQLRVIVTVRAPQPDLARQRVESTSDLRTVKPVSPTGDEQVRRHRTTGPMTLAPGDVIGEDLARGAVQRNQTGPAELGLAHRQYGGVEVDIPKLEFACFGHTETGHGQQAEQSVVDPGQQCALSIAMWQVERGPQQVANLFIGVQIRCCPLGLKREQAGGWGLRTWIGRLAMPREAAYVAQSRCPCCRLHVPRLLCPGKRQGLGNDQSLTLFHEGDEVEQGSTGLVQLEPQMTSHAEVLIEGLSKRVHRAPPGHGKARRRRASRSTLA